VRLASGGSHGHSPRVMDAYSTYLSTAADDAPSSLRCSNLTSLHTSLPDCVRLFLPERDGRSYRCCKPRHARHCRNSPRDNRPDKSDSSPSATVQAPVPQPMERLHLTDSQACPQASMVLPSPTQDLQVPDSSVGTASARPYLRYVKEVRFMGSCPRSRS
jgi:hypothetical protein